MCMQVLFLRIQVYCPIQVNRPSPTGLLMAPCPPSRAVTIMFLHVWGIIAASISATVIIVVLLLDHENQRGRQGCGDLSPTLFRCRTPRPASGPHFISCGMGRWWQSPIPFKSPEEVKVWHTMVDAKQKPYHPKGASSCPIRGYVRLFQRASSPMRCNWMSLSRS